MDPKHDQIVTSDRIVNGVSSPTDGINKLMFFIRYILTTGHDPVTSF